MSKQLQIKNTPGALRDMRIGGPSLTGGVIDRPLSPDGASLRLILSIPAHSMAQLTGISLSPDAWVSVFSVYSSDEYFLEHIVYHGDPAELLHLMKGYTRAFIHPEGSPVTEPSDMPAYAIASGADASEHSSRFGGAPKLLQNERIETTGLRFALQFYAGDVPKPHDDLLYMNDAIGYLFLPERTEANHVSEGLFFAQVT